MGKTFIQTRGRLVKTGRNKKEEDSMKGKAVYRGVVFGMFAMASTNGGHTVVRPVATTNARLGSLLAGADMKGCVGKSFKLKKDEEDDAFGVRLAVYRSYRALVGMGKSELQRRMRLLNNMQKECKADQIRDMSRKYPKLAAKATTKKLTAGKVKKAA
jgi:hypothetical protein